MKILVLSNGWTTKISGGEEHILQVTKYWSKNHNLMFILPSLGYNYCKELLLGKTFMYNSLLEKEPHGVFNLLILYFMRILRTILFSPKTYFDVIIASSHYPYDVIPAIFLKFRFPKSKLIVYFHGLSIPHANTIISRSISIISNYLGAVLIRLTADLIFTVNKNTQTFLLSLGVKREKISVTSNGVDAECFSSKSRKMFDGCFIGRHYKYKGIYDLLKIWEIVCKFKPDAKLAICGYGVETPKIEKLLKEKNLVDNVCLLGFVLGKKKYTILNSSHIFIFPSYLESWGMAVAEAMSCGLSTIAYDLPVYTEVFGGNLVTVPLGDVAAMAKQVVFLLENPDVATKIGEASKEFVKRYDWKTVAEKELSVIINLIKYAVGN